MTHNYNYELLVLPKLIKLKSLTYLGVLGPKKKYLKLIADLKKQDITLTKEEKEKIFAPIGLELGAETSEEIALSIAAEIQKSITYASGLSLRVKKTPIHFQENLNVLQ